MNTTRRLGLCTALIISTLLCGQANGQKKIPYNNSVDSISVGIGYADTGAYAQASIRYESVSENDTNYALALVEDAVAKESSEQDSAAIMLCRKGMDLESDYTSDFYSTLAGVYIDEGNYTDAVNFLKDTALVKYPNIHTYYYTLGLAQYKMHKYGDAINSFEKSIDLDMYDAGSHYYLGRCCLEQGRLIPALLSLQFYLLLQPDKNRSFTVIQLIEQMVENKYQYNKFYSADPLEYHDSAFTELDLLIRSKIALNAQYKATTHIGYTFIKQIQLLFEQLKYVPNTGNYWMEKYVPFCTGVQEKNYLEPYLYYIMASVAANDQGLQKDINKNAKEIKNFTKWADAEVLAKCSKKEVLVAGKKVTLAYDYWDNDMIESIGEVNSSGKYSGECTYYYRHTGAIYSQGKYNDNGEREGKWQWFYNTGALKETDHFVNGKKEDSTKLWYENGAPKATYIYHNDLFDGNAAEYNVSGILTAAATYQKGELSGAAAFFYGDGKQHYKVNYANGKLEGEFKEYYATGQPKSIKEMHNDEKNGAYTAYLWNGKVQETGEYKNDARVGHWKTYYADGHLQKEGDFNQKGAPMDTWTIYFRNGKKEEMEPFNKNGGENGVDSLFDDDGIVYEIRWYKNDIMQEYTFQDKGKHIVASGKPYDRSYSMINYSPEGKEVSSGMYMGSEKEGAWQYYNCYGKLTTIQGFHKDSLNGLTIDYYSNGKVKDSLYYTSDERNGYYVSYYINGKMDVQGWYVNGNKEGDWHYYDLRGNLIKHHFFVDGALHGRSDFYRFNGMLSEQHFYRYGYMDKIFVFDSAGNITYKYISDKGNGKYLLSYNNGSISHELNYTNGLLDGPEKRYYYDGKLSKECNYLLDNLEGTSKAYYENGNVKYAYKYVADNSEDTARTYYESGKPQEISIYDNDNLEGEDKCYYEDGKLDYDCYYSEGELEGEYKAFFGDSMPGGIVWFHDGNILGYSSTDKNGKPLQRISLDSGTGVVTSYYPNGNKSISCQYINGAITGERLNYNPDGKLSSDENFESGYRTGPQKYYYDGDTALKEVDNYYYGEADGIWKYYYKNGTVEHEEPYILGSLEGPCRYYDEDGNLLKTVDYLSGNEVSEISAK